MYESTVNQEITRLLTKAILSGQIRPGDMLEPSKGLAKRYKVNINIVNQVIQQFTVQGILWRDQEANHFVTNDVNIIEDLRQSMQESLVRDFLRASAEIGIDTNKAIKSVVNKGDVNYVEVQG